MPIQEDLIKTASSPVHLSSRTKTEKKKDSNEGGQYTVPSGPKCFGCQGFGHIKQEYLTYLKTIRKRKALTATLSDTEPEDDSDDNDDE